MTSDMKDESDAAMDRLLAGTLKARPGVPADGACLDADTVAAWADEALGARERQAVEAHAAGCARCQALLAAMVQTLPPPQAAAPPLRRRAFWWLAAIAPVAAALVVWFAVPQRAPVQQSQSAEAGAEQAASAPSASPASTSGDAAAKSQADAPRLPPLARPRDAAPVEQKGATPLAPAAASADALAGAAPAA
ncbi:MAG: hypothetical protein JWL71_1428, partial [Acidobacteria bacterium]|nr:hypothetical protein [Acidobacteriota bacterium]